MFSDAVQLDFLMPLQFFYLRAENKLPEIQFVNPSEIPEPQRHLLVHASDMTPRLRDFHTSAIALEVLQVEANETFVMRLVKLKSTGNDLPVEFGAIGIDLSEFAPEDADLIRGGKQPLGGILESQQIPHKSSPKGYFSVVADAFLAKILETTPGTTLYGRCNALSHMDDSVFADIVEILPP